MANEPDITYPYLFNYVDGEEWRTQQKVRELIRKYYFVAPDGIPGNDDTGTLSTWLLFGMMGIYPDCPGNTNYTITSPIFDRISIKLDSNFYPGENLVIETTNNQEGKNIYIDKITFNGKKYRSFFIDHHELTKGGTLQMTLRKDPKPK